ncbi:MAG: hypothetical protein KC680_02190 [Candidatus Peregrinibacteria bacterium]|nr:hypothetical protein [Candidatus Peregrinibacteria bacterium]MCB9808065.1 hypothetical protein [Candidatus Peribacteria bacterium]
MKTLAVLAVLVLAVVLCDRFKETLPTPIKQIYTLWETFSHYLGIVMSFLMLTVLWIVGFGMYGIILKIISLPKRFTTEPDSFWIDATPSTKESMHHQF